MPFATLPPAGAKLPASTLFTAINDLRPVVARKFSTEVRNSTIVEAADAELRVPLPANSIWEYELLLLLSSAANAAGDFSGHMEYPAGASADLVIHGLDPALPSGTIASLTARAFGNTASPMGSFALGCSTTNTSAIGMGRIVMGATAGDLVLFWAQQVSNGNDTRVLSSSRLTARMIG